MSVVPLTLTISLCLVFTFVLFFLREFTRRRFSGAESDSLLPLADETPRLAGAAAHGSTVGTVFEATGEKHGITGDCGSHSDDAARAPHDANACTRNCAACRLRALHRAATPSITVSAT